MGGEEGRWVGRWVDETRGQWSRQATGAEAVRGTAVATGVVA